MEKLLSHALIKRSRICSSSVDIKSSESDAESKFLHCAELGVKIPSPILILFFSLAPLLDGNGLGCCYGELGFDSLHGLFIYKLWSVFIALYPFIWKPKCL